MLRPRSLDTTYHSEMYASMLLQRKLHNNTGKTIRSKKQYHFWPYPTQQKMNQFECNHNLLSFTCKVPLSSWMAVTITSSCCCTSPSPNKNKRLNADITLWASFAKYLQHHYSSLTSSVFWVLKSTSKSAEMFAQTIIQKSTSWVSVTLPEAMWILTNELR